MRRRFVRSVRTGGRELLITSQQGELINTKRAKWLHEYRSNTLLRFAYDLTRDGLGATLHYDVEGLVNLKSFIKKHVLGEAEFSGFLISVQDVIDTCAAQGIPSELIVFDPTQVFVDNKAQPRFVVIPLDNTPYEIGNSPLEMLRILSDSRHLLVSSPRVKTLSARLESFVLSQNYTFSLNDYRSFMYELCGVDGASSNGGSRQHMRPSGSTEDQEERLRRMWSPLDGWDGRDHGVEHARYRLQRISSGESFPLVELRQTGVGRGSQNDIQLIGNPKLSRSHVVLQCSGSTVSLMDLGSANGTWIQGQRLRPSSNVTIPVGQHFSLANEEFVVKRS